MKLERLLFFLLVALASNAIADDCDDGNPSLASCPENEVPSKCGNCRRTCSVTVRDPDCVCTPGCICVPNYLRDSYGTCVPETQCDAPCENDYGKIFDPCGAVCQRTCDNVNDPNYSCTKPSDCTNLGACRCFEGLVLNKGGQCVRPEDCPITCGPNEAYSECMGGPECEGTCADPKRRWSCVYPFCNAGCTCAVGYLRDNNGVCTSGPECFETCEGDPNARKVFCTPCGGRQTCSSMNDLGSSCISECDGKEGCDCKSGYVLHKGKCIPKRDCPTCSGKNEAYLCRKCELSSSNFDPLCADKESCTEGCYCIPGYARNYYGECVKLAEVSQPPCGGDPNAYFEQCRILCEERTCLNKDTLPECLSRECVLSGRCECKAGYVKTMEGKCILPENCECNAYHQRSFLPPSHPSYDYVIPSISSPPSIDCAHPSNPSPPSYEYVPPSTPSPPSYEYVPPSSPSPPSYEYVPPSSPSPPSYEYVPHSIPSYEYVPPSTPSSPSYEYVPPSIPSYEYVPPSFTSPPSYEYVPPSSPSPPSYEYVPYNSYLPNQCGHNEIYDQNPTVCIPEDDNCKMHFKGESRVCYPEESCSPRCRCLPGFVRNSKGECIIPQQCCEDPNSVYTKDYSTCPGGTCANPTVSDCGSPLLPFGCVCKEGYLKISSEDSTCIPKEDCCLY